MRFSVISAEGDEQMKVEVAQPLDPSDKEKKGVQSNTEAHKPWLPYVVSAALTEINAYKDVALWIDLLFHLILWIGAWVCQVIYTYKAYNMAGLWQWTFNLLPASIISTVGMITTGGSCGLPQQPCATLINLDSTPFFNDAASTASATAINFYNSDQSSASDSDFAYAGSTVSHPIFLGMISMRAQINYLASEVRLATAATNTLNTGRRTRKLTENQLNYTFERKLSESPTESNRLFYSKAVKDLNKFKPPTRADQSVPSAVTAMQHELDIYENPDSVIADDFGIKHRLCKVSPRLEVMKFKSIILQTQVTCALWDALNSDVSITSTSIWQKRCPTTSVYTHEKCLVATTEDNDCYSVPQFMYYSFLVANPAYMEELTSYEISQDYWETNAMNSRGYTSNIVPVTCWTGFSLTNAEQTVTARITNHFVVGSTVTYSVSFLSLLSVVILHLIAPTGIVRGRLVPLLVGLIVGSLTASIVFDVIETLRAFGSQAICEVIKATFVSFRIGSGSFRGASSTMEALDAAIAKVSGISPEISVQWVIAMLALKIVLRRVVTTNLNYPKE
jgi:hypothetical protein